MILSNVVQNVSNLFKSNSVHFYQLLGFHSKIYHNNFDLNILPLEIEEIKLLKFDKIEKEKKLIPLKLSSLSTLPSVSSSPSSTATSLSLPSFDINMSKKKEINKEIQKNDDQIKNNSIKNEESKKIESKNEIKKKNPSNLTESERLKIFLNQIYPDK